VEFVKTQQKKGSCITLPKLGQKIVRLIAAGKGSQKGAAFKNGPGHRTLQSLLSRNGLSLRTPTPLAPEKAAAAQNPDTFTDFATLLRTHTSCRGAPHR
jgi:hypothetical protein